MKITSKLAGFLIVAFAITFVSCNKKSQNNGNMTDTTMTQMSQGNTNNAMSETVNADNSDFTANLTGANQVPSVETNASGMAYFKVSNDGSKLMYTIKLSNADSVLMAHIHYAPKGKNGPPVVWLYPSPTNHNPVVKGSVNGVLKSGTITNSDLVGPLQGKTVQDLVQIIKDDSAYVNIHNKAHKNGLIRGQVQSSGMMNSDGDM